MLRTITSPTGLLLGGLVDAGVQTQEEDLFRRSNYYTLLHKKYYPMKTYRTIISKGVQFWLDKDFNELSQPVNIDCVASPSLCGYDSSSGQKEKMKKKIQMLFYAAHVSGNDSIVLSAWGCGAFHCDAHDMAALFKEVIDEGVSVKKIIFAILGRNYEIFSATIHSKNGVFT